MSYDGTLKFDTKLDSSGLNSGMSKLGSLASSGFKAVGKIVTAASAAVTAFGASALKAGGEFSSGMSKVEAIAGDALIRDMDSVNKAAEQLGLSFDSGASDAEKAMATLEAQALKTASTSTFTAGEVSQALTYMGMAGWDTGQMLGGLQGVIDLAEASGEDLATTSDIVTDAMTAFGMVAGQTSTVLRNGTEVELENTARFVDVLSAAASSSNTNVALMGETFKYVAPVAGSMGYSIEDTAQAIGLMANQGIKGSQAGTALRNILTNMAKPTNQMAVAMEELGVSLDDGEGNMLSLMDVMYQLREGFSGLKLEDTELIDRLSELDAQFEAGNITQKEYEGEVDRLIDLTYGAEGALNAQYAAMLAGKYGMSGLLAIVNTSDEDFEALAQSIADSEGRASEMAATMKDNLPGALKMANSALDILKVKLEQSIEGPAKDAVLAVTDMINGMTDAFDQGGLEGLAQAAGESIAGIAKMIVDAAPTIIDTAVMIIHSFCETIKSQDLGEVGASLIQSIVNGIFTVAGDLLSTAGVLIMQLVQGITPYLPQMLQTGIDIILNLINGITQTMPTLIPLAVQIVVGLLNTLVQNIPMIIDAGLQLVQGIIDGLVQGLPLLIDGAIQLLLGIVQAIPTVVGQIAAALPQIITAICDALIAGLPQLMEGAVTLLLAIVDAIPQVIDALVANLPAIIQAIVAALVGSLPAILEAAITLFTGLIQAIPATIASLVQALPEIIAAIVQGLLQSIPDIIEAAIQLFFGLIEAIPEIIAALITALPDIITCIVTSLTGGLPQIIEAAVMIFGAIVEEIPNIITRLGEEVPHIWEGIVNGLKEGLSSVKNAAVELGQSILGGIKEFFGIHSPSTVMEEQGDYLVAGMMNGLAEMPGKMAETLSQTVQSVLQWGQEIATNMGTAIQGAVTNVISIIQTLPGQIWNFLTQIVTQVIQWAAQLQNQMRTAATNAINAVVQLFSQFPAKIWTWLTNIITKVVQWASQLLSNMRTAATNAINAVVQLFSQFPAKIWTWLQNVITKVIQWAAQLLSQMTAAATNAINKVVSIFQELPGKIQTTLTAVITKVIQWAADMASKASSAATGFVNALVNGLSGLPAKMQEIGGNIVQGIWKGISDGWSWLTDKVKNLANDLLDAAKSALGINSPSKLFAEEVGEWIPPGIGKGVSAAMPQLISQTEEQMAALAEKMQAKVTAETGNISIRKQAEVEHSAETEAKAGDTITYDQHIEQDNSYYTPVATPSEVAKSQREAARKLLGGVK